MKKILFYFFTITLMVGCKCRTTVNPNEWVVSTATCWNTMTVSKAGSTFPALYTTCDKAIVLPATEMAAEFVVETKFQNRVAGNVKITYRWKIIDPIAFMQSAKSIVSSEAGSDHKVDPNVLEEIENSIVDKILIDIIREYTPPKAAGLDELELEKDLNILSKSQIVARGVEFSNMSANIVFGPQTEEALDVLSALKFYEANGEGELGRAVIKAKAGATTINLEVDKQIKE